MGAGSSTEQRSPDAQEAAAGSPDPAAPQPSGGDAPAAEAAPGDAAPDPADLASKVRAWRGTCARGRPGGRGSAGPPAMGRWGPSGLHTGSPEPSFPTLPEAAGGLLGRPGGGGQPRRGAAPRASHLCPGASCAFRSLQTRPWRAAARATPGVGAPQTAAGCFSGGQTRSGRVPGAPGRPPSGCTAASLFGRDPLCSRERRPPALVPSSAAAAGLGGRTPPSDAEKGRREEPGVRPRPTGTAGSRSPSQASSSCCAWVVRGLQLAKPGGAGVSAPRVRSEEHVHIPRVFPSQALSHRLECWGLGSSGGDLHSQLSAAAPK